MTVNTPPIMAYPMPKGFLDENIFLKSTPTDNEAPEERDLYDKVDLALYPGTEGGKAPGYYEKSFIFHEEISTYTADTRIEYENEEGSKVFIQFSYRAISRKVHYEVVQNITGAGSPPDANPHPLNDYFGPGATADRILGFAQGLVNKFRALEGYDREKLEAFIQELIKGINKGFGEVYKVLGPVSGQIGGMINETYDRVMKGMALLEEEPSGSQVASQRTLTYEEEVSYTYASLQISVTA